MESDCLIGSNRRAQLTDIGLWPEYAPLVQRWRRDAADITPYLAAPGNKRNAWRNRLGKHDRPRVGLVWAGDPRKSLPGANRVDRRRSLQFDQLAPVLQVRERGCRVGSGGKR